jgi:hypothetical protein
MLRCGVALLLVVADVSPTRGGDLHVLPRLDAVDPNDRGPFTVRVVLPDGTAREAQAMIDVPHVRGSAPPMGMLRLLQVSAEAVPIGTRVER